MKTIFRLLTGVALFLVAVATVIKYVQGVSYKEAVGIMEECWKEMKQRHCCCCGDTETPEV